MGRKRNQYTKEYKVEAVRLMVEEGRPISELARELGTFQSLLHRWKKKPEEGKRNESVMRDMAYHQINDTLGHDVGNELLQVLGSRLKECLRQQDTVARLGGDEFILLFLGISN